jgi:hypothetical protein
VKKVIMQIHYCIFAKVEAYITVLCKHSFGYKNVFPTFTKDYNNLRTLFITHYPGKMEFVTPEIVITDTLGLTQVLRIIQKY